jgi:hypothetical protein
LKKGISDAVTISDLGQLARHLGVDYEFGTDANSKYLKSSMTDYLQAKEHQGDEKCQRFVDNFSAAKSKSYVRTWYVFYAATV